MTERRLTAIPQLSTSSQKRVLPTSHDPKTRPRRYKSKRISRSVPCPSIPHAAPPPTRTATRSLLKPRLKPMPTTSHPKRMTQPNDFNSPAANPPNKLSLQSSNHPSLTSATPKFLARPTSMSPATTLPKTRRPRPRAPLHTVPLRSRRRRRRRTSPSEITRFLLFSSNPGHASTVPTATPSSLRRVHWAAHTSAVRALVQRAQLLYHHAVSVVGVECGLGRGAVVLSCTRRKSCGR